MRFPRPPDAPLSHVEVVGGGAIADGVDRGADALARAAHAGREPAQAHGGRRCGVAYDPLDVSQYTEAEFRAAVEAAENWGTYVTVHAYTPARHPDAIAAASAASTTAS